MYEANPSRYEYVHRLDLKDDGNFTFVSGQCQCINFECKGTWSLVDGVLTLEYKQYKDSTGTWDFVSPAVITRDVVITPINIKFFDGDEYFTSDSKMTFKSSPMFRFDYKLWDKERVLSGIVTHHETHMDERDVANGELEFYGINKQQSITFEVEYSDYRHGNKFKTRQWPIMMTHVNSDLRKSLEQQLRSLTTIQDCIAFNDQLCPLAHLEPQLWEEFKTVFKSM